MIDVSELIHDPDFSEPLIIIKKSGAWKSGEFRTTDDLTEALGIVRPTSGEDVETVPEGDRKSELKTFFLTEEVSSDNGNAIPDIIVWNQQKYKVVKVFDWGNHGFYKAVGSKTGDKHD